MTMILKLKDLAMVFKNMNFDHLKYFDKIRFNCSILTGFMMKSFIPYSTAKLKLSSVSYAEHIIILNFGSIYNNYFVV